jgi:hypothetical protein
MNDKPRPWQVQKRDNYDSPWVRLHRDDVRLPDGSGDRGHHVVDFPYPAVCVLPIGDDGRILLIDINFITDTIGWEVPAGRIGAASSWKKLRCVSCAKPYTPSSWNAWARILNGSGKPDLSHLAMNAAGELTDTNEIIAWPGSAATMCGR